MNADDILSRIRTESGIVRAEIIPDELMDTIVKEESTVTAALGNMPVINSGLDECLSRDVRLCIFENGDAWHPSVTSMRMVNEQNETVGHDIPQGSIADYRQRDDVIFLSDDFVMYPERDISGTLSMEMLAVDYTGRDCWIPLTQSPVIWYPSSTSSELIMDFFGHPRDRCATGILAFNV